MAADPDFTEELLWKKLSEDIKTKIMTEGVATIDWGKEKYPISKNLIEDGRKNLLLGGGPGSLNIFCPVRLIHSLNDEEVPYKLALQLVENIQGTDASVTLLKNSRHSMESESDIKLMRSMISEVIEAYQQGGYDLRSPGSG
jgi:pimeloyl-ACP methyl ester carboxylesterase